MNATYLPLALSLFTTLAAAQQLDPVTDFEVNGHVFEPQAVPPTDARIQQLSLPTGFVVHRFAEGLDNPRMLAVSDDGTVYVTERRPGRLVMLKDTDHDGVIDTQKIVARIKDLHGIEIRGAKIYLVAIKELYSGDLAPDGSITHLQTIADDLPDAGQHPNRTLRFGPDNQLYLSIGSDCNACIESNPEHATMERVELQNGKREIFASGLRNTIGFDWQPTSGELYGMDHGIDWLGDNEQTEELNVLKQGARYGWPFVYDDDQFNPQDEPEEVSQATWANLSTSPVGGYTAHAAPMQMQFYSAGMFPQQYRGNAFIAMHGSWNRKPSSGYEVVRAMFDGSGKFTGFEPFLSNFLQTQPKTAPPFPGAQPYPSVGFIGRPTGLVVAKDGALLVGDDTNNVIYRVAYASKAPELTPQKLATEIVNAKSNQPIQVRSSVIGAGSTIPLKYSDYGKKISPPLSWSALPAGSKSFVLLMEDPDATSPLPFVHWSLIGPASATSIPENIDRNEYPGEVRGSRHGSNSHSERTYFGPRPPEGDKPHHYHFELFALDTTLNLPSGFNRHALLNAMQGHVIAKGELVGMFAKSPANE